MPTAVLSSQTGGVTGYTFLDMTDQMAPIAAHWKAVDARFDAIYTGFLGSEAQLSVVEKFFDDFAQTDTLLLVDPVMGDDGEAYDNAEDDDAFVPYLFGFPGLTVITPTHEGHSVSRREDAYGDEDEVTHARDHEITAGIGALRFLAEV